MSIQYQYTIKRFEDNPYETEYIASVLGESIQEEGKVVVVLEETIFYPTGGGQPHDIGWINEIPVIDVYKENGVIYHVLESSLQGEKQATCQIDWNRRFDHMQQHSGQHLLSRAFEQEFHAETMGFYLGKDIVTIDITLPELTDEMIEKVEAVSNQIVTENRRIQAEQIPTAQINNEMKDKIPELEDYVRMVQIEAFDECACAGTHPKRSGEIGFIKVLGWEKYKKMVRVSFVCGHRAFQFFSRFQKELTKTAQLLKTNLFDVRPKVHAMITEKEEINKTMKAWKEKMLTYEVDEWKQTARYNEKMYWVESVFENRDFSELKQIAQGITQTSSSYIVLFSNKTADKVQLLLYRSGDIQLSMNEVIHIGLEIIDGKGGGNPQFAQGGGPKVEKINEAMEQMRKYIFQQIEIER